MRAILRHARPQRPYRQRGEALLVEVLVSSVVLVTAFSMAASMGGITARALRTTDDLTSLALAVTENIADINDRASRYTYCSGRAGFSACSSDSKDNPGNAIYYTPRNSSTLMETFQAACSTSSFNSALINEISNLPVPTGVNRNIIADTADLQAHRFRVIYTSAAAGTSFGTRMEVILPNVATFCP